jgi:hypothetical protein
MGPLAVDLSTAVIVLVAVYARPTIALGILIATVILVPAPFVIPHLHSSYATVNRAVIAAVAVRLAAMVRSGAISRDRFRATPLHLALALLIAVWTFAGVVFAPSTEKTSIALDRMVGIGFVALFFVVTLALLREIDQPWLTLRILTGTIAVTAVIATVERFTGDAFGHWLFAVGGNPGPTVAAHALETRAGHVRVRASGEFALAYGWVCVMALPAVTLVALRMRRMVRVGVPMVALVILAIYWTYSRSAAAAVPVIFVLLALAVRDRRTTVVGAMAALASIALFAADPTVRHHLSLSSDQGSVGIRFQRFPPILEAVAHHAYLGLGFGGLGSIGIGTTDNFYLSAYAETGVVGAAVLVAVCLTALAQTVRGLALTDPVRRAVVAASVIGFLAFLASGAFDDALLLGQPAELAFLLLAIAIAAAEPELGFAVLPTWSLPRLAIFAGVGGLAGLAALLIAPTTVSQERTFTTVTPLGQVESGGGGVGNALVGTVCDLAANVATTLPATHITCRDDFTAPGVGTLRVESPSSAATLHAYTAMSEAAGRLAYLAQMQTAALGPPIRARATAWQTAPASGAAFGFVIGFVAPLPIRRRRPDATQDADHSAGNGDGGPDPTPAAVRTG